jgi:MFS family permease
MVLMLCRYSWASGSGDGLALLGLAVGVSGAGFFVAAVVTPWAAGRLGPCRWIIVCAGAAAVLEPALCIPFTPTLMLLAAFVLGMTTQGAKIATDTIVQASVDDGFRGRIFSVYDVLFNVAFVGAAATAALMLPTDGQSVALVVTVALVYASIAAAIGRFELQ